MRVKHTAIPLLRTSPMFDSVEIIRANECEYCGATDKLAEVSDCDPAVGYHSKLWICRECFSKYKVKSRFHCGSCR